VLWVVVSCALAAAESEGLLSRAARMLPATDPVRLIQVHHADGGKPLQTLFTADDVAAGPLRVAGYITGLVVLCDEGSTATLDGRRMEPMLRGADGSVRVRNQGKVRLEALFPADRQPRPVAAAIPGAYAYFPAVAGDAVSPEMDVALSVAAGGRSMTVVLKQRGYTDLCAVAPDSIATRAPIPFTHAGDLRPDPVVRAEDLQARSRAVAQGIGTVEAAFSPNLIDGVTIIDAADQYNAVTCNGRRRIWFYRTAFLQEPVNELSVIAEHESLHILVDLLQLTGRTEVRELFADLKGYDTLSRERLELVTRGWTSAAPREDYPRALFFPFISESNFIEGMKGGHPQADPEEFCTSFLHTLMYSERFDRALSQPFGLPGAPPRGLTGAEKRAITDDYRRTLDVFEAAIADAANASPPAARAAARLAERINQVRSRIATPH
jgi:hypothetical protein